MESERNLLDDLKAEIARLRPHYQSETATDAGRRQMLDHFDSFITTSIVRRVASSDVGKAG